MKLEDQIHCIQPQNSSKIETIKLWELFQNYNIKGIKQIIRFNSETYRELIKQIQNRDINLFNKVNTNVNNQLISNFNNPTNNIENYNKALIIQIEPRIISWTILPVLIESTAKISKIIEMNDISITRIIEDKLYEYSIDNSQSFEEFKNWFIKKFEWWRITKAEFEEINVMFYRKIELFNNK